MALITWNSNLSVNVAEIDLQHRKLVSMINELGEAMKLGKGKEVLEKIINGLSDYAVMHFQTEENYFNKFGYPDAVNHKREHAAFIEKVTNFKDGYKKGTLSLSIEIMNFLSDWLGNHITKTDKQYSKYFNDKGLK